MKCYGYEVFENEIGSISIMQNPGHYEETVSGDVNVWVMFTPEQIDRLCEDLQKIKKEMLEGKNNG